MNMKLPKPVKVILIVFVAYAGLVAVFASVFGIFQPEREDRKSTRLNSSY